MKLVFDTNIYISFLLSKKSSPIMKLRSLWEDNEFQVLVSKPILKEIAKAVSYPKIIKSANMDLRKMEQFLSSIHQNTINIQPKTKIDVIKNDASDNKFLELAVDGKADYIISGDKPLLNLDKYRNIEICSPLEFIHNNYDNI